MLKPATQIEAHRGLMEKLHIAIRLLQLDAIQYIITPVLHFHKTLRKLDNQNIQNNTTVRLYYNLCCDQGAASPKKQHPQR